MLKTVEVDLGLDEFENDRIVEYLVDQINDEYLDSDEEQSLMDALRCVRIKGIDVVTLDDEIKLEHIAKVFHKYTSTEIEQLLNK